MDDTDPSRIPPSEKSAFLVAFLNTVFVGGGYIYLGQTFKGVVFLLLVPLVALFTLGIGVIVMVIFAVTDGLLLAKHLNNGESIGKWQFF